MGLRESVAAGLALLSLSGCATNAIRLDRAGIVSEAGRAAGEGTRGFLDEVTIANREKQIAVAALDPNCRLPTPVLLDPAVISTRICIERDRNPAVGDVPLTRFDSRAFAPTIAVLEGLTAYLDALDEILTRKRPDVGAELDRALAQVQGAAADVATLAGTGAPPAFSADQQAALTGLVSLISTLANEAATVRDLRRLESPEQDKAFADTILALRRVNKGLPVILTNELQQQRSVLELVRPRDDARSSRAAEMRLIEREEAVPALTARLTMVIDELARARAAYVDLLRNDRAKLTPKERTRLIRLNRARLLAALSSLASVRRAFIPGAA